MKKLFSLIILIIIAGVIYIGSPYYSAYQLKNAYEAQDGAAIAQSIDYERLRPNLKEQLQAQFAATLDEYPMVAQLGGEALHDSANRFIDNAVEGAITPSNIEQLVDTQGQVNQATKKLAATWAIASNQVNLRQLIQQIITNEGDIDAVVKDQLQIISIKQAEQIAERSQTGEDNANPQLSYCSANCFYISTMVRGYPVIIEMQRVGFIDWKIVNVQLPD